MVIFRYMFIIINVILKKFTVTFSDFRVKNEIVELFNDIRMSLALKYPAMFL